MKDLLTFPLRISLASAALGLALLPSQQANACSCMRGTPETQMEQADAVFEGTVISLSTTPANADDPGVPAPAGPDEPSSQPAPAPEGQTPAVIHEAPASKPLHTFGTVLVTFRVSRVFKGELGEEVTVKTAGNSAACGYGFEEGASYVVYARAQDEGLSTGLCSGTKRADDAEADFAVLGAGVVPVDPSNGPGAEAVGPATDPLPSEPVIAPQSGGCASCTVGRQAPVGPASLVFTAMILFALRHRRRLP